MVAAQLLTRVVDDQRNLDALTDRSHGIREFTNLGPQDQGLARAIAVTALRNRNRIDAVLKQVFDRPPPKRARFLIHMLHVAACQILFLETADRAAVDLAVDAIRLDPRTSRFQGLSNAVLRRMVREKDALLEASKTVDPFPKWFSSKLRRDYGKENSRRIGETLLVRPSMDISVKSDAETWSARLGGRVMPNGSIRLSNETPVRDMDGYADGEWWVQDVAASIPAQLIQAEKGDEVLELCAAPGGKTAQLIAAGYKVTALDVSAPRLKRLSENLERLKYSADIVEADILEWEPEKRFDAVLLDAPCSSTGTVRRHPDVLWTRSADEVSELAKLQFELLKRAAGFVKPGGCLVFSNCSIFKEEGEDLLARAKKELPELTHEPFGQADMAWMPQLINGQGAIRSLPFHQVFQDEDAPSGMDGFFAARFIRT